MSNPLLTEMEKNRSVPWPEFFNSKEDFNDLELRTLAVRRAVLMNLLGMDTRPLQTIADELGITRQAVSKLGTELADLLGFNRFIRKPETRARNANAAEASWQSGKRKSPPADKTGGDSPTKQR